MLPYHVDTRNHSLVSGMGQEKTLAKSLVQLMFTIKHNYINTTRVDSFSSVTSSARVMLPGIHYADFTGNLPNHNTVPANNTTTVAPVQTSVTVSNVVADLPSADELPTNTDQTSPSIPSMASVVISVVPSLTKDASPEDGELPQVALNTIDASEKGELKLHCGSAIHSLLYR